MNTKQASATQTRERLLEAATRVIQRDGGGTFTLEQVAKEAGVSKGGLLHHFASKEAIVEALIRGTFSSFEARVQSYYDREPKTDGAWLRAYIRANFDSELPPNNLVVTLLSFIIQYQQLQQLIEDDIHLWRERLLNDGISPTRANIIRLTCDAYWTELLVSEPPAPEERLSLVDELLRLAGPSEA